MKYKLIAGLAIICLMGIFIIQNTATIEIQVYFWTIIMSRVLLMIILLGLGMLTGWLLNSYFMHKSKKGGSKRKV